MLSNIDIADKVFNSRMSAAVKTGVLNGLVLGWIVSGPAYYSFINNGSFNSSFYSAVVLALLLSLAWQAGKKQRCFFTACSWYYLSGAAILLLFLRLFIASKVFFLFSSFLLGLYAFYLLSKLARLFLFADEPVYLVSSTLLVSYLIYLISEIFLDLYPQYGNLLALVLSFSSILFLVAGQKTPEGMIKANDAPPSDMNIFVEQSTLKRWSLLLFCFFIVFLIYTQGSIYLSDSLTFYSNYPIYAFSYILYFLALILVSLYIRIFNPSYLLGYCLSIIGCAVALGMIVFEGSAFLHLSLFLFSLCAAGVDIFTVLMLLALARQSGQAIYFLSGLLLYWFIVEISSLLGPKLANSPSIYTHNLSAFIIILILLAFPLLFTKRMSLIVPGQATADELIAQNPAYSCEEMDNPFKLTPAEKRVYQLVCQGLSNDDIAGSLQISTNTVKFHVRNILQKAGVKNRRELLALTFNQSNQNSWINS